MLFSRITKLGMIGGALVGGVLTGIIGFGLANASPAYYSASPPTYKLNARGQTYGSGVGVSKISQEPDLMQAVGTNGKVGYVYSSELYGSQPKTPQQAVALDSQGPRTIPLYASDGKTVIGSFVIGGGTSHSMTIQQAQAQPAKVSN